MARKQHKRTEHTLQQAFLLLIEQPNAAKLVRAARQTVHNKRTQAWQGIYPKEANMRAWLRRAGWVCTTEERWATTSALESLPAKEYLPRVPRKENARAKRERAAATSKNRSVGVVRAHKRFASQGKRMGGPKPRAR